MPTPEEVAMARKALGYEDPAAMASVPMTQSPNPGSQASLMFPSEIAPPPPEPGMMPATGGWGGSGGTGPVGAMPEDAVSQAMAGQPLDATRVIQPPRTFDAADVQQVPPGIASAPTVVEPVTVEGSPAPPPLRGGGGPGRPAGPPGWLQQYAESEGLTSEEAGLLPHRRGDLFTPDELAAAKDIEQAPYANAMDQFDAQEQAQQQINTAQEAALRRMESADADERQRQQQRVNYLKEGEDRFASMAQALTDEPIDSNRLWNSKNTGEKIMSSIAVMLAGAAGGPEGAKWALGRIDEQIERDVRDQQANKALSQSQLAAQGTLIGMARQRFQDEAAIDAAMKEGAYRRVKQELERFAQYATTPVRQAQLEATMNEIDARILDSQRQRRLAMDAEWLRRQAAMNYRPDPRAALLKEYKLQGDIREAKARAMGQTADDQKLNIAGFGRARDDKSATAMRTVATSAGELERNLKELERLTEKGSGTTGALGFGSDDYKQAETLVQTGVAPALAKAMASGFNPSGPVEERAASLAGGLTSKSAATREATRKAIRKQLRSSVNAAASQHIVNHTEFQPGGGG